MLCFCSQPFQDEHRSNLEDELGEINARGNKRNELKYHNTERTKIFEHD